MPQWTNVHRQLDIVAERGADLYVPLKLVGASDVAISLAGFSFEAYVWDGPPDDSAPILTLTILPEDVGGGLLAVTSARAAIAALPYGTSTWSQRSAHTWRLAMTPPSGRRSIPFGGSFRISP